MAGIRGMKWAKIKENHLIEHVWRMYQRGFTPVDISLALNQPLSKVNYWIALCENVNKMRKRIQEEIEA